VGALDRLLEEKRVEIEGISATSAGVMDATALAYGFATGGRDGARAALAAFLEVPQPYSNDFAAKREPYEFNPFNLNPPKDPLEASIDFEALRESEHPIKLFLSATNVRTGKVKVFERYERIRRALRRRSSTESTRSVSTRL
jgi:NTE family protein